MNIYIRKVNGWLVISDDDGNRFSYLYYSKREALSRFKSEFGYKRKRGIVLVDYTA